MRKDVSKKLSEDVAAEHSSAEHPSSAPSEEQPGTAQLDSEPRMSRRGLLGSAAAGGLGLAALLQSTRTGEASAQTGGDQLAFFALEVDGRTLGTFVEVTGIGSESVIEGGDAVPAQSPSGRRKYTNIVLKRGADTSRELWDWRKKVEDGGSDTSGAKKDGSILLLDQSNTEVARWNFVNAWPSKISAGHAKLLSDDVMILEELTLSPESIQRVK